MENKDDYMEIEPVSNATNSNDSLDEDTNETNEKEVIEKDFVPHYLPTYRIRSSYYAVPIILVIVLAGALAYLTYFVAGIDDIDGGYLPEGDLGAWAGIINGIIFTAMAAGMAFLIIFLIRKLGMGVIKYIFGISFAFLGFFMTYFFASSLLYAVVIQFPETELLVNIYYILDLIVLPIVIAAFTVILVYKYFKSKSIATKNFIVLYFGLLIGASMGVIMPLWTTVAILIGVSIWDLYAVLHKTGPIKKLMTYATSEGQQNPEDEENINAKIESGEAVYDTSKLEIGIGDLAFYSMLTSAALIHSNNVFVMFFTAIAVIIGTGITILGLKRNKVLPGLPISIFSGIATMFLSWFALSLIIV